MVTRKPRVPVVVALANKMARNIWALMAHGESHKAPTVSAWQPAGVRPRGRRMVSRRYGAYGHETGQENQKFLECSERGIATWSQANVCEGWATSSRDRWRSLRRMPLQRCPYVGELDGE